MELLKNIKSVLWLVTLHSFERLADVLYNLEQEWALAQKNKGVGMPEKELERKVRRRSLARVRARMTTLRGLVTSGRLSVRRLDTLNRDLDWLVRKYSEGSEDTDRLGIGLEFCHGGLLMVSEET